MTVSLATRLLKPGRATTADAVRILAAGGLVAFPTETVYGLGADATNGAAVARLYAAKGRPAFNPLIAHVTDTAAARALARFDADAARLAAAFWPGPLTLVLPKSEICTVSELATAGLDSIAVRVPHHAVAQDLLAAFGRPVVAPSANRSGHVSPTTAAHVLGDLSGRVDLIVDGGPTPVGVESTIVACLDEPALLRPGGVPREAIEHCCGVRSPNRQPGSRSRTPRWRRACSLRITRRTPACGSRPIISNRAKPCSRSALRAVTGADQAAKILNLSARGDLIEAAANLFSHLRALDAAKATLIAVMPLPRDGLGEAINDRLQRAAAPREIMSPS